MEPATTRDRLLHAAQAMFLAQGFDATSMDQVRQAAGVSNGSLYHHFPTKQRLADALYAHILREFHAVLMQPLAGRGRPEATVRAMVQLYIDWVVGHPGAARLLHELKRVGALTPQAEWSEANAEAFGRLADWVRERTAAGEMRPMPFTVWMAVVFAPVMQLTPHWVAATEPAVPAKVRAALEHAAWAAVAP